MKTIKERPILLSAPMVRAILEGRKTQTRRVIRKQFSADAEPAEVAATSPEGGQISGHSGLWWDDAAACIDDAIRCPYGKPGDLLWVRETWGDVNLEGAPGIAYRADDDVRDLMAEPSFHDEHGAFNYDDERIKPYAFAVWSSDLIGGVEGRWRQSIHMPRWAARILLEVIAVRVERLHDISEADARAEGARECDPASGREVLLAGPSQRGSFVLHYRDIWEQINGPGSWDANPWVWVIKFRRVEP